MDQYDKEKLEKIAAGMQCPKDFKCRESGSGNRCKVEDIGIKSYLVCRQEDPMKCEQAVAFGEEYFCKCPVRIHIARELHDQVDDNF